MRNKLISAIYSGGLLAACILVFTSIDYLFHKITPEWEVPEYYFRNKIIFGFLIGAAALYVVNRIDNLWVKSAAFSGIVVVLLQIRYFLTGYPLGFVITFLFIHFAILYFVSAAMFYVLNLISTEKKV